MKEKVLIKWLAGWRGMRYRGIKNFMNESETHGDKCARFTYSLQANKVCAENPIFEQLAERIETNLSHFIKVEFSIQLIKQLRVERISFMIISEKQQQQHFIHSRDGDVTTFIKVISLVTFSLLTTDSLSICGFFAMNEKK